MEKLIKIQSIIMEIEKLNGLKTEYRTIFNYKDDEHLEIECFCSKHLIDIWSLLRDSENTSWYIKSNTTCEIVDFTKYVK